MKTPSTILNNLRSSGSSRFTAFDAQLDFNLASWRTKVSQLQRLQKDFSHICYQLGLPQASHTHLYLEPTPSEAAPTSCLLTLKTSAALAARLRHIEPDLKLSLNQLSWNIDRIHIAIVRHAHDLSSHLQAKPWTSTNEQRLGKRTQPNPAQRALLLARFKR